MSKDDEALLEEETASPANRKRWVDEQLIVQITLHRLNIRMIRSMLNQRSVPWLRKTEYISTEQSTLKSSFKPGDIK